MYQKNEYGYNDTGKRRVSSLTGPSFGLNLVTTLGQMNYMDGAITKQVSANQTEMSLGAKINLTYKLF